MILGIPTSDVQEDKNYDQIYVCGTLKSDVLGGCPAFPELFTLGV